MHAVTQTEVGGPDVLHLTEQPDLEPGPGEVLIDVVATAVNRADSLQRQGHYPPPPGTSDVIGLECSGRVAALGADVTGWRVGDEVCALLAGGGYATQVVVPAPQVMPAPTGIDLETAAALPEAAATVWSNLWMEAALSPGESLLVHGGAGGLGTLAIQLAASLGHRVLATAGGPEKVATCRELGADVAIDYRDEDFVDVVKRATDRAGVDVVMDVMGGSYLDRNLRCLATGGRLAVIGLQGGTRGDLDLGRLLTRRARVIATSLRPRPVAEKGAICAEVVEHVWPLVANSAVAPVVDLVLPLSQAARAHERLDSGRHTGKIVLVT